MDTQKVSDLMIPLDEYATVSEEATLSEAIVALEKAQEDFNRNQYPHRAILVYDKNKNVVGKISQLDILRALEPKYKGMFPKEGGMTRLGFSRSFTRSLMENYNLWQEPFNDICRKAAENKVREFMYTPEEGEFVREDASLNEAIHQLVIGHHQSLLVTRNHRIVGILRLVDVFKAVFEAIRACGL